MSRKTSSFLLGNPSVWYLGAWCLYYLQGSLYDVGSSLSKVLLISLISVSLYHAYATLSMPHKPIFFKGLNGLVLMYTIYGLLLFVTDGYVTYGKTMDIPSMNYLKSYYISLLPIYSCYYYTHKKYLTEKVFSYYAILFVVVGVFSFYYMQQFMLDYFSSLGSNRTEITNNSGYVMLAIIPALMVLYKKPLLQYICVGICLVYIIFAMKRGAILCAALFLLFFIWHKMKYARGWRKIAVAIVVVIGFQFLSQFIMERLSNSDYFMARIEKTLEGNASGREDLYTQLYYYYVGDAGSFQKLFGNGANGTIKLFENYAHNDWLEIAINQGLLGLVLFLFYCFCFLKTTRSRRLHQESKFALLLIFVLFITQTFFSAGITNTIIYTSSMIGFALADGFRSNSSIKRL